MERKVSNRHGYKPQRGDISQPGAQAPGTRPKNESSAESAIYLVPRGVTQSAPQTFAMHSDSMQRRFEGLHDISRLQLLYLRSKTTTAFLVIRNAIVVFESRTYRTTIIGLGIGDISGSEATSASDIWTSLGLTFSTLTLPRPWIPSFLAAA